MADEAGEALAALARIPGARTKRLWTGWRVAWGLVRVDYRGGLAGLQTVVRVGREVVLRHPGLSSSEEVLRVVRESGHDTRGLRRSTPSG